MYDNIYRTIKINRIKFILVFIVLFILLVSEIILSVGMGTMKIGADDIVHVIANRLFGANIFVADNITAIVWNIRLPRIICACFVGMGLAVSGVIFQGILQNPLADPYTLGISTGASFGASLALIMNILMGIYFPATAAALIGSFLTLFIVILIAEKGNSLESSNLIIAGIIISSILSSGVSFIKMLAGESVGAIVFWIMGSLSAMGWKDVMLVSPTVIICTVISVVLANQLDIMALGDNNASALGINTHKLRFTYLVIGSVITAVCVSACGVIGFVGLIVPHLLRIWITAKNQILIPLSALLGALLLLTADSITRIISAGEIPVGVLTTIIGGPFFIFVFTRKGGSHNV